MNRRLLYNMFGQRINSIYCLLFVLISVKMSSGMSYVILTPITLNLTTPSSPNSQLALDGNSSTSWTLASNQTTANISAQFSPQAVFGIILNTGNSTTQPNSIRVRLVGTGATGTNVSANWVVYFNKTCTDFFYHWRGSNDLTQCVQYKSSGVTQVDVNTNPQNTTNGVFFVVNSTDPNQLIWWQPFNRVDLEINGVDSDFSTNSSSSTFSIAELTILGWSSFPLQVSACNCDPTGVESLIARCNSSQSCQCRAQSSVVVDDPTCKPFISPIQVDAYYGPVSGGTVVAFSGNFLSQPTSITIGGLYPCALYPRLSTHITSTDQSFKCIVSSASQTDIGKPMPFHVCWGSDDFSPSCVITRDEFTYRPDPSITSISRSASIAKGGLSLTVTGVNFDSLYGVIGNNLTSFNLLDTVAKTKWPYINILVSQTGKDFTRFPDPLTTAPPHCDVVSSTTMTCKTPENNEHPNAIALYTSQSFSLTIQLEICLGLHDELYRYLNGSLGCYKKFNFMVFPNPKITPFNGVQYYDGYPVTISGEYFLQGNGVYNCCSHSEYVITVGGQNCTINNDQVVNAMSFVPPPGPWPTDSTENRGASTVILYLGDYSFTIGSLFYVMAPCDNPSNHCAALIGGIVGGVGGLIVIAIAIIIGVLIFRRMLASERKQQHAFMEMDPVNYYTSHQTWRDVSENEKTDLLDRIDQDQVREKVKRCVVPPNRVEIQKEIGRGNFGRVCQGLYTDVNGTKYDAAIKVVMNESVKDKLEFLWEAVIMADFNHENVLTLLAITIVDERPHVVLPLMEHGDLRTYISNPANVLTVRDLIFFAKQIADGMNYLAVIMKFVHRDLAARNCMVNKSRVVKVADFGLARDIYDNDYYRQQDMNRPLPFKWMAIECLGKRPAFTTYSDVWSYGVLLWELFERGTKPYGGITFQLLKAHLNSGNRLSQPSSAPDFIYDLMLQCWRPNPIERPTFSEIASTLQSFLDKTSTSDAGQRSAQRSVEAMAYRPAGGSPDNGTAVTIPMRAMGTVERQKSAIDNSYIEVSVDD